MSKVCDACGNLCNDVAVSDYIVNLCQTCFVYEKWWFYCKGQRLRGYAKRNALDSLMLLETSASIEFINLLSARASFRCMIANHLNELLSKIEADKLKSEQDKIQRKKDYEVWFAAATPQQQIEALDRLFRANRALLRKKGF